MLTIVSTFLKPIFSVIWDVLKLVIPVPIFVILVVGLWYYYDKTSSIKIAVKQAVTELVAGSELAAKDAVIRAKDNLIESQKQANMRLATRLDNEEAAKATYQEQLDLADNENTLLERRLLDALSSIRTKQPKTKDGKECNDRVDQQLYDILHGKREKATE